MFADSSLTDEEYTNIAKQVEETTKKFKKMHMDTTNEVDANYIVLVFKNRGDKATLVDNLGVDLEHGRFANAHDFLEQLYDSYEESMQN